jgi:hypothetical protein
MYIQVDFEVGSKTRAKNRTLYAIECARRNNVSSDYALRTINLYAE